MLYSMCFHWDKRQNAVYVHACVDSNVNSSRTFESLQNSSPRVRVLRRHCDSMTLCLTYDKCQGKQQRQRCLLLLGEDDSCDKGDFDDRDGDATDTSIDLDLDSVMKTSSRICISRMGSTKIWVANAPYLWTDISEHFSSGFWLPAWQFVCQPGSDGVSLKAA